MLKLKEIARQRDLFSSLESLTSETNDSDEEYGEGDDDYLSNSDDYSYGTDEDVEENASSSYSSVWRKRRKDRRYSTATTVMQF